MELVNFTKEIDKGKIYIDKNNKKKIIITYNNQNYIIKTSKFFIDLNNKHIKQTFNPIAEHIGCQIYNSVGIQAQKTILGFYQKKSEEKRIVVACQNFLTENTSFKELQNIIDLNINNPTDIEEINECLKNNNLIIDNKYLIEYFWDMFIIDALINIEDRGINNWGFLYNTKTSQITFSPIFDCENCFFSFRLEEKKYKEILSNNANLNYYIFQFFKKSFLTISGTPLNYFTFISSLKNEECNKALKRVVPKINLQKINMIIDNIDFLTEYEKNFYKIIIQKRKELFLDFPLFMLLKKG